MGHTPGPWTIGDVQWIMHQQSGLGYSYRPINAGSWELAQVWEDDHDAEMAANVHLVAAAPELLAALKNLTGPGGAIDDHHADFGWLRGLIAKAEGRTND